MKFEYTYRDGDGALKQGFIEAVSRQGAFADLKCRGIAPVGMRAYSGKTSSAGKSRSRIVAVLGTIAAVLAVGVISWLLCSARNAHTDKPKTPSRKRIPTVHRTVAGGAPRSVNSELTSKCQQQPGDSTAGRNTPGRSERGITISQPGSGEDDSPVVQKPVFDNAADQILAMATSGKPGVPMPPLPIAGRGADMMFMASLEKPIEIKDTDPEAVKAVKQRVLDTREEVKALMEKGLSFQEIMQEHQGLVNDNASIRTKAMIEAREILESGDQEGAETFIKAMNKAFAEMGIDPIRMPGKKYGKYSQGKRKAVESAKISREVTE